MAGRYYLETHGVVTPVYNLVIAFSCSVLGFSPLDFIQYLVAILAVITVVGGYCLGMRVAWNVSGGIVAAVFLLLFGTFVFVTESGWKESLGIAMFVLFVYSYINRSERRFFVLEVMILLLIPFVHHLVAAVVYLLTWYLTVWSIFSGLANLNLRKRHLMDAALISVASVLAYTYYRISSLDRLIEIEKGMTAIALILSFVAVSAVTILVLRMRRHSKLTFAPIPALALFGLLVWDYFNPLFPYVPSAPILIVVLIASVCVLVGLAWYGLEIMLESKSKYRVIPLGLMLPFLTLAIFTIMQGMDFGGQQVLYRTFDYADFAIALGLAVASVHLLKNASRRTVKVFHAGLLVALLLTLPFAYSTGSLTGVRHDTQTYEVDALDWIDRLSQEDSLLQSDERLSYVAMALYDFEKMPWLPRRLMEDGIVGEGAFYVLEEEWMSKGVNAFPEGYKIIDQDKADLHLTYSDVLYVGGPSSNNIVVFWATTIGQGQIR